VPLQVPGFGHVFLYADNRGAGYTRSTLAKSSELLLNYEFATDRLATVRALEESCRSSGVVIPTAIEGRIAGAGELWQKARALRADAPACARTSMESLRESLWAGEALVLQRARHRIARQPKRPGFLFGSNVQGFASGPQWYRDQFVRLFNYATVASFYLHAVAPKRGERNYYSAEATLNAMEGTGLLTKGHPLFFMVPDFLPEWIKSLTFPEVKGLCLDLVREGIGRFRSRIHVWDVVNEGHVQPDGGTSDFTRARNVELTVAALKVARETDPTCYRLVNSTGTWTDYYMGRNPAPWQQSVYDYLEMLKAAGAEYEAIGLQYYHSGRDMLEFERNLETFGEFGKSVHLTELGISSSSEDVPDSEWWGGGAGGARMVWHGEQFTETMQADWFEQLYTIAYSKPWVDAVSTWDFADPAFIPHGGLVRQDGTPKESYRRLSALLAGWRG
jgi:GH35 family endo-1,4-beta-xylanase